MLAMFVFHIEHIFGAEKSQTIEVLVAIRRLRWLDPIDTLASLVCIHLKWAEDASRGGVKCPPGNKIGNLSRVGLWRFYGRCLCVYAMIACPLTVRQTTELSGINATQVCSIKQAFLFLCTIRGSSAWCFTFHLFRAPHLRAANNSIPRIEMTFLLYGW